jgi:mevalonate kinase
VRRLSKNNFKSTEAHRGPEQSAEVCALMGTGSGKGKSILFGEHFVVYGIPSVAAGIAAQTTASVKRSNKPGWSLEDDRPAMPGYKEKKSEEQRQSIDNVLRYCGVDTTKTGIHIEFGGDLVCASGVGASAASCVALARALNSEFRLGLSDDQVNEAAYEGEKGYHGTPSGIDNTASTYGGLIWYIRDLDGGPPTFERIRLREPMHLVIAATGITASTKEVVDDVRAKRGSDSEWFEGIVKEYETLVHDARDALIEIDRVRVGQLMDRNHSLLQDLTVSCKELDSLVSIARKNGAMGAKMTGTGRGGNMIALAVDRKTAEKIAHALEKGGAVATWVTEFGL